MQNQFRGLKQAAGEGMFKALNAELKQFATGPLFPMLKKNFALTSTAIGGVITKFSDMVQESGNLASLDRIMKSKTVVIGSMGSAATNLGQAFISITDAARPMTKSSRSGSPISPKAGPRRSRPTTRAVRSPTSSTRRRASPSSSAASSRTCGTPSTAPAEQRLAAARSCSTISKTPPRSGPTGSTRSRVRTSSRSISRMSPPASDRSWRASTRSLRS